MFNYFIRYNVYSGNKAPEERTITEMTDRHMDEQGLKKILETKHGATITLISWKETHEVAEKE